MKINELRVGNWYKSVKWQVPVKCDLSDLYNLCANSDGAYDDPPIDDMFEPILLTEEWLQKLGFHRIENGSFGSTSYNRPCWIKFSFTILIWDNGKFVYDWNGGNTMLNYVHQLQNLYYALTGEELNITS
jgi:hypothetical protein